MGTFLIRRIAQIVPTLLFVSILIFGLQQLLPGDPAKVLAGEEQDPAVIAHLRETMHLDDVEQWKIVNTTTFWHTFHIHINDYQLTKINGQRVHGLNYDDNVSIPPNGSVTMRTRPTDFTGKFVYHCHVLGHEDAGMMGIVRVVK